jgi:hypothetical protein
LENLFHAHIPLPERTNSVMSRFQGEEENSRLAPPDISVKKRHDLHSEADLEGVNFAVKDVDNVVPNIAAMDSPRRSFLYRLKWASEEEFNEMRWQKP